MQNNNQTANLSPEKAEPPAKQPQKPKAAEKQQQEQQPNSVVSEAEKKRQSLALLEAALYVAGRPLELNELCSVITTRSKKKTETYLEALRAEYASRNTSMEILRLKDERYVMQVKAEFTPLVKKLVNRPLLSSGPLKTLSYIAFRQPIMSKRVIEVRGQHAYGHIKVLKEMGLVAPERNGRSIVLKTTDYFSDYFGLTQDTASMKRELRRIFGDALKDER
ncbi:MAG: SMC-Scp complex subunit ScpB [Candidatus Bathyarchaeota archaeon]|nr:SMC-Scp complex subunit ScpB [Candidatus Bathyarchaeota archaeon]